MNSLPALVNVQEYSFPHQTPARPIPFYENSHLVTNETCNWAIQAEQDKSFQIPILGKIGDGPLVAIHIFSESNEKKPSYAEGIKEEIRKIYESTSRPDWDGDGADPITLDTLNLALELVDQVSFYPTKPDVSASPFGTIDFDWFLPSGEGQLTIHACPDGKIAYAALIEGNKAKGSFSWDGKIRDGLMAELRQLQTT